MAPVYRSAAPTGRGIPARVRPFTALLLLLLATCGPRHGAPPTVRERLGEWPFLSLLDAPTTVALREGGDVSSAASSCGGCHTEVYAEWGQTTHAAALTDVQFLAELAKPDNPRWLCLNCHIPLASQRPYQVQPDTRLASADSVNQIEQLPNPGFDPAIQAEAITCGTCHVRRDADGQGIVIAPADRGAAPHRVRADPDALRDVCVRCHSPGPAQISPTFVCWFETAQELAAGPQAGAGCVDCHMPSAERALAAGGAVRTTRQHHWVGGGVPKSFDGYDGLLARGWSPGVEVQAAIEAGPSGTRARVTLRNTAGHALPTGDPERHLSLRVALEDPQGAVLAETTTRLGQTWDWGDAATGRAARRLADDRLRPGETRALDLELPAAGPDAAVVVELQHVRLSADNARYMQQAALDPELLGYRPTLAQDLARLDAVYPRASWLYAARYPLGGGAPQVEPIEALIARSRAAGAAPVSAPDTR